MNIAVLTKDTELIDKFKRVEYFNDVYSKLENDDLEVLNSLDIIVLSDKIFDFNAALDLKRNKYNDIKYVFYMVTEENYKNNIKSVLEIENIKMIPPKLTKNQIVEMICEETMGIRQNKNIVVFYGADSKVGTTQTAQGIAELIANNSDANVFLAFLNGKPSTQYINTKGTNWGLDPIKGKLLNNIVSINELMDACIKVNKLTILPGANTITNNRHFHPKHIEFLLQIASKKFDLVIIDAGSNIEAGMTIGALNATTLRYLITTQQQSSFDNFAMVKEQILLGKLNIEDFMLVINKYIQDPNLNDAYTLAEKYNLPFTLELPFLSWGWQSENDRKSLLSYNDTQYTSQMNKLAKVICKQLNIQYNSKESYKVPWYKKIIS